MANKKKAEKKPRIEQRLEDLQPRSQVPRPRPMPCLLAWRQREIVLTRPRCSPDSLMNGALFFTVALLVIIAYFLMGGLPLLVLKHDVPLDARFIRTFFNAYYAASAALACRPSLVHPRRRCGTRQLQELCVCCRL